jgi:hypothetical protein
METFLSDTFFKSFSSKYFYVEGATTMAAPSLVLSPEAADMNGRFQMQGGKNWILPK